MMESWGPGRLGAGPPSLPPPAAPPPGHHPPSASNAPPGGSTSSAAGHSHQHATGAAPIASPEGVSDVSFINSASINYPRNSASLVCLKYLSTSYILFSYVKQ